MPPKKKVLLIDDVEYIRHIEAELLQEMGYKIIAQAKDGEEGLNYYHKYGPDLVVLDISMPKVNGLQVLNTILKDNPKAKIVMCSAIRDEKIIRKCYHLGATNYIVKPFKENEFKTAIKNSI